MAKVTLAPMIKTIRGKVGGYVFRRTHTGEISLSKSPRYVKCEMEQGAERTP